MKNVYLITLSILCCFSCHNKDTQSEYYVFDMSEKYPIANINLNDVATIEYIKLKPIDSVVISCTFTSAARELLVTKNNIFYCDNAIGAIHIFDRDGNQLSYINKTGRGPGEYIDISTFNIDTTKCEIYIFDQMSKKMLVYDYKGNCILTIQRPKSTPSYSGTEMINDSIFLGYYSYGRKEYPLLSIFNKQYECVQIPPLTYERPFVFDPDGTLNYPRIISAPGGSFISEMRSDTLFFINHNSLEVYPRFVDISNYGSDDIKIYPTIETPKYVFFSRLFSYILTPGIKRRYYCFNKENKRFYTIKQMTNGNKDDNTFLTEHYMALIKGYAEMEVYDVTQNHNIAATFIPAQTILDNHTNLPENLKKVSENIQENDSPILMLMHFNKS